MPKVTVHTVLSGVPQLVQALQRTDAETRSRTKAVVERSANKVADGARQRAPKVSGELAHSIRAEAGSDELTWFVKEGYGKLLRRSRATTERGLARYEKSRARHAARRAAFRAAKSSKQAQRSLDMGIYAPVVERGDKKRNKPARPHLYPAAAHERPHLLRDLQAAPIAAGRSNGL